jgi:two-component system, chemotaxis family, CheB/CheR fusion protein
MNTPASHEPEEPPDAPEVTPAGEEEHPESSSFPIVGAGASAGGLEAFTQLLKYLPDDTGLAFVLVQHLDPRHESQLVDLLSRATRMPVIEAADRMAVRPDHVYVIPRNTNMAIAQGRLTLTPRGETPGPHLPIDTFFRSLAKDQSARAIGVILSGTGSDGALGMAEIKAAGGITFAQDQVSAQYASMPHSAIVGGCVDFVLPPAEIARELARIGRHPYLLPPAAESPPLLAGNDDQFRRVLAQVRAVFGVDFTQYRDTTIMRRVRRRMVLHSTNSLAEYARRLEGDRSEVEALYHDLLINVTRFFRDPELFESLKSRVFPEILQSKPRGQPIRVWVAGCSTGQEAYSLIITLLEFLEAKPVCPPIQIFATDLSDAVSLAHARAGLYPESIEAEVSPERLRRFFTKEDGRYRINKSIRDMCVFARQNVAADPPFSRLDLVSCRNVLIYLAPPLQRRVIPTFHYALNPTGFLVLGTAETVGGFTDLFEVVDRQQKIYNRKTTVARPYPHFATKAFPVGVPAGGAGPHPPLPADWEREADRVVLGRYAPAGVLVNDQLEILQFRGRTSSYLEPAPGEASLNLLKMAREGLFAAIRGAIDAARTQGTAVRRPGARIEDNQQVRDVDVLVIPVRLPGADPSCFLVLFEEATPSQAPGDRRQATGKAPAPDVLAPPSPVVSRLSPVAWRRRWLGSGTRPASPPAAGRSPSNGTPTAETTPPDDREVAQLRQDLAATGEYLQSIIEQKEVAYEEMQSANEEILAANEELQSTNEELETAKEELQSVNEELTTINEQLEIRNQELTQLTDDLSNLLGSADLPVVMLGRDLRIRRFTAIAGQLLNLLPTDVGRPLGDLKPAVDAPDLEAMIREVMETAQLREREVRDRQGRWYALRIHPYRTAEHKIDGAVVVLLDIDEVKRAQEQLREARDYAQAIVDTVQEPLLVLNADLRIDKANHSFYEAFQVSSPETEGQLIYELGSGQWDIPELRVLLEEILPANRSFADFAVRHHFPGIGLRTMLLNAHRLQREDDQPPRILLAIEDITARQQAEEAQRFLAVENARLSQELQEADRRAALTVENARLYRELQAADQRKDEFLAMLAHELRNPLAPIRHAVQLLQRLGPDVPHLVRAREIIERQVIQQSRLLDDLLDVSRISRGTIMLRPERLDLVRLVRDAMEDSRTALEEAGLTLTLELPEEPVWVEGDPTRLAQVMSNLLQNAVKFTDRGGRVTVGVQVFRCSGVQEGGSSASGDLNTRTPEHLNTHVAITVRDTGIGIAPELLPHVFEAFTQAERSLDRSRGGLGLGLAMVKGLVEQHGGEVRAESAGLGHGTAFTLRLPVATAPAVAAEPSAPVAMPSGPRRILIVEDNRPAAETLRDLLKLSRHTVEVAYSGSDAVRAALQFQPEVVLCDLGLPGMDGYQVAAALRQNPATANVRLIALSGYGQEEDRQHSREAGFDLHLVKPVDFAELERLLEAGAGRRNAAPPA